MKRKGNNALKYINLGTTLGVAIAAGVFGGQKLDEKFGLEKPLITIAGALLGITTGLWMVIKDLK